MSQIVARARSAKSMCASVVISPAMTTRPVVTSVSTATREAGYSLRAASRMTSEIWSAILSGCPSVTDSEVKWNPSWSRWLTWSPLARDGWSGGGAGAGRAGELGADQGRACHHGGELGAGDVGQQVAQAAVGIDHELVRGHEAQRPPDPLRDQVRGLHLLGLHVDHAEPQAAVPVVLAEQAQVLVAGSGELQRQLADVRLLDRREQEVVMPLPQRPGVPVAVADVQRPAHVGALGHDVDRLDGQPDVLGIAGQERLVDLQHLRARPG